MKEKYSLYGFMTIADLIDNTKNMDSPIGELSDEVRTYALDKGYYAKPEFPDVRFVSFRSQENDNTDVVVPLTIRDLCIRLGDWCFRKSKEGVLTNNLFTSRQAFTAEFNADIKDVTFGQMVLSKGVYLPQYIEFKLKDTSQYNTSFIKIWFSDKSLKQQYPFYDIVVVPLVENIDDFFQSETVVAQIKNTISLKKIHDKTNVLRGKSPYTYILTDEYDWHDKTNQDTTISIPWTVIVYGPVGNNTDLIRHALAEWILAHSAKSRDEWEVIFPDIFIPTEYVFVPVWNHHSVPGYRLVDGLYSPILKAKDIAPLTIEAVKKGYTEDHIREHVEFSTSLHKSIAFSVIGNPKNRLAPISFYSFFPQYSLLGSRTDDFNRLDDRHQKMMETLAFLFATAETAKRDTEVLRNQARVERDGILYISTTVDNIQYLMVAKSNYDQDGVLRGIAPYPTVGA